MITTSDFAAFHQQLRQEVADVIQQVRVEVTGTINSRVDMLNSINAALPTVTTKRNDSKAHRISDIIPRSWEGSNEKEEFRRFMPDLDMWTEAWSNEGKNDSHQCGESGQV